MAQQGVSADVHLERAARHRKVGDALFEAEDEWAAVCYFYSAYHLIQHAFLTDPIFDDALGLQAIHPTLVPDHRFTSSHKGRQRPGQVREWGVNELVHALYRPVIGKYDLLHQASIHVRYHAGLHVPLGRIRPALEVIEDAHTDGELCAKPAAPRPPGDR